MIKKVGKIIISGDINVWPHEMQTAQALVRAGYTVEFVAKSNSEYISSADVVINGYQWEMKAPKAPNVRAIDRNLRKALHQATNIIFDSRRMKALPDEIVERELRKHAGEMKTIRRMLFVNRHGQVIDIK